MHLYSEAEALSLMVILVIQLLHDLEGASTVVVPHHGELVCAQAA